MLKKKIPARLTIWKPSHTQNLEHELSCLGLLLDVETGHIFYRPHFKSIKLNYEIVFVRHGETFGNCGQSTATGEKDELLIAAGQKDKNKRIYQGNVDTEINQLTDNGKQQALEAAEKLKTELLDKGWIPDIIYASPLARAQETAYPFVMQNNFSDRYAIHHEIREMSFGGWENRRICDLDPDDACHLFYREQNTLVKDKIENAECFCDVILRAKNVLLALNNEFSGKKILLFSHSMFGAACCILLGHGQKIENGNHLAFDGQRKNGSYYTMANAQPFLLNVDLDLDSLRYKKL